MKTRWSAHSRQTYRQIQPSERKAACSLQDMIHSFMQGYPEVSGALYEEPFVDFSTTRNYALQVSSPSSRDSLQNMHARQAHSAHKILCERPVGMIIIL